MSGDRSGPPSAARTPEAATTRRRPGRIGGGAKKPHRQPAPEHLHWTQRDFRGSRVLIWLLNPRLADVDVVGLHVGQTQGNGYQPYPDLKP